MHGYWHQIEQRIARFSILLLPANAFFGVGFLVLRLVLIDPVHADPLADLGIVLMTDAFALWVLLSSATASAVGFIGVARGGPRKRGLALACGHALLVFPYLVAAMWSDDIGGTFADRGVDIRRIAGTEHASALNPASRSALSLSPDERWVTYWEEYLAYNGQVPAARWQLASVDLTNGRRTAHSLGSLRNWRGDSRVDWDDIAWGFDPGGWSGAQLFIDGTDFLAVIDPARAPIESCASLPKRRSGPDSPSQAVVAGEMSRRGMRTENYELERQSLVWTPDGKSKELYYVHHLTNGVDAIMCRDGEQAREILRKQDWYGVFEVNQVRVSPDRSFLAYSALATGRAYLPIPDRGTTVFIRHLPSGKERRAGRHSRVSNLIWSADSRRLYYAGDGREGVGPNGVSTRRDAGVYCTDVAVTFPVESYPRVPPRPPDPTPREMRESATSGWQRYVEPGGSFSFRYPQHTMVLDELGDIVVLRDIGTRDTDSCSNQYRRPERFYAQVQVVRRDLEDIVVELAPEYRDGQWSPIPGRPFESVASDLRIGSVSGTRFTGPADCEYTYVLPIENGTFLVITRAARPENEKEDLAGSIPALGDSHVPGAEDPTFALILSSMEFNP